MGYGFKISANRWVWPQVSNTHLWATNTGLCFLRRICPGMRLANSSVWIAIASILATLQISKAVGDDGNEIVPEVGFTYRLTRWSRFFSCRFHCLTMSPVIQSLISVSFGSGLNGLDCFFHNPEHGIFCPLWPWFSWFCKHICKRCWVVCALKMM